MNSPATTRGENGGTFCPSADELRQRLWQHKHHQPLQRPSPSTGPVDVDDFLPSPSYTARPQSAPRRLVRSMGSSNHGNNNTKHQYTTRSPVARDVTYRWTAKSPLRNSITTTTTTRPRSGRRGVQPQPPPATTNTTLRRTRAFSPPGHSMNEDPLSPRTRASKKAPKKKDRPDIDLVRPTSGRTSRPSSSVISSSRNPREYAAQYYAAKVRQQQQPPEQDSLAEFMEQSTVATENESFFDSVNVSSEPQQHEPPTSQRWIYTSNKAPSPEQVSRQVDARKRSTRPTKPTQTSPTSVLHHEKRIFRVRHDDDDDTYHDPSEVENISLDDTSSSWVSFQPSVPEHILPLDDDHPFDEDSRYAHAIRHMAAQDQTIASLHTELVQAREELQTLSAQLASMKSQLATAEAELARRSQAHETISSATFREQIAAEEGLRQEMAKTQAARQQAEVWRSQVVELQAELARRAPESSSHTTKSMAETATSQRSGPSSSSRSKPTTTTTTTEPSVPESPLVTLLESQSPPKPPADADRASCVTEVIANTSRTAVHNSESSSSPTAQAEIDELRFALVDAQANHTNSSGGTTTTTPVGRSRSGGTPTAAKPPPCRETETALRQQLRIVRGLGAGEATSEQEGPAAVITTSSSSSSSGGLVPPPQLHSRVSEQSPEIWNTTHAKAIVDDEEVKSLMQELRHMKESVAASSSRPTSSQPSSSQPSSSRPTSSQPSSRRMSRSRSARRTTTSNPDQSDEAVVDFLRRQLDR